MDYEWHIKIYLFDIALAHYIVTGEKRDVSFFDAKKKDVPSSASSNMIESMNFSATFVIAMKKRPQGPLWAKKIIIITM